MIMFASWKILTVADTEYYINASGAAFEEGNNVVVHGGLLTEEELEDVQEYLGSKPGLTEGNILNIFLHAEGYGYGKVAIKQLSWMAAVGISLLSERSINHPITGYF